MEARGHSGAALLRIALALWSLGLIGFQASSAGSAAARAAVDARAEAPGRVAAQTGPLDALSWGYNFSGQLGNGTTTVTGCACVPAPGQIAGLSGVTALAGGGSHSLALGSDGTVWAWGLNGSGQLGNGTVSANSCACVPSAGPVTSLSGVAAVGAGFDHSLAAKTDGTVWAWGDNYFGELGNGGTSHNSSVPGQVVGLSGATAVAAGTNYSLALKNDGTVWAWGINDRGELGNGSAVPYSTTAVQVSNLSGVRAIAAGSKFALALKNDGAVWAWGANDLGQLGNATPTTSGTPVQVSSLSGVVAIAAGLEHGLAVKTDGTVWAWGANQDGELGNGTSGNTSSTPVQVSSLSGVTAVAAGQAYSLALKSDGTVWAWGRNPFGELGIGQSGGGSNTRVQVTSLSGVSRIAAGGSHGLALGHLTSPPIRPRIISFGGDPVVNCAALCSSPSIPKHFNDLVPAACGGEAGHWEDCSGTGTTDRNWPMIEVQGQPLTFTKVQFQAPKGFNLPSGPVTVRATVDFGSSGSLHFSGQAPGPAIGSTVWTFSGTLTPQPGEVLPNQVNFWPSVPIHWQIQAGAQTIDAGTSQHPMFTVWRRPVAPTFSFGFTAPEAQFYLTTVAIGSLAVASPVSGFTDQQIVNAIWARVATRTLYRFTLDPATGAVTQDVSAPLRYWDPGWSLEASIPITNQYNAICSDLIGLLETLAGRCGVWGPFFGGILGAQGLPSNSLAVSDMTNAAGVKDFPKPNPPVDLNSAICFGGTPNWQAAPCAWMLVDPGAWQFSTPSGADPYYPYRTGFQLVNGLLEPNSSLPREVRFVGNTRVQGSTYNPPGFFAWGDHIVVKFGSQYYDPSYGTGPFTGGLDWATKSLAGWAVTTPSDPCRSDGICIFEAHKGFATNVAVQVVPSSAGQLQSTISARDANCSPNSQLQSLRFTALANARIDVLTTPPAPVTGPTTVPLPSHPASVALIVHQLTAGQAATVQLVVTDGCGDWATLVGGGPQAFTATSSSAAPAPTATPASSGSGQPAGQGPVPASPTPAANCAPRPTISVATTPLGPGRLQGTVTAPASANDRLATLRFGAATNARVEAGGQRGPGGFSVTLAPGTQQTTFVVERVTAGQAATVALTVMDSCGEWPTFIGLGPNGT